MSEEKCVGKFISTEESDYKHIPCDKDALYIGCDGPCCEEHKCRCAKLISKKDDERNWANDSLKAYLENSKYRDYNKLIDMVLNSDSKSVKYNLITLLMELGTNELEIENLQNRLKNIYCQDKSLEDYINDIVQFNPKLNSIDITTASRRDIKDNNSLYLQVDKAKYSNNVDEYFTDAKEKMEKIKDYLRIILTESKNLK